MASNKKISFALFRGSETKVFNYYLRGIYFNARMIKLLLPDYRMVLNISKEISDHWESMHYISSVSKEFDIELVIKDDSDRCGSMLWRFETLYSENVERVLCRDLDSIITQREVDCIRQWEDSDSVCLAIQDNTAHSMLLMGGLCAFRSKITEMIPYEVYKEKLKSFNTEHHGQDQSFLCKYVEPLVRNKTMLKRFPIEYRTNALWESNLTCSFIGSAGVNEMELIRFFESFDHSERLNEFEKQFPRLFYWHLIN